MKEIDRKELLRYLNWIVEKDEYNMIEAIRDENVEKTISCKARSEFAQELLEDILNGRFDK